MASNTLWHLRATLATAVLALLTGCGGGNPADAATPRAAGTDAANAETAAYLSTGSRVRAMAATAPTIASLTVRARGTLLNEVGPVMQIRVDDTLIGTVEVRNTTDWADFSFSAPTLQAGSKVEVVYTNDATATGADRNLFVAYVSDGRTVVLPNTSIAVIDQGGGVQAFDGLNIIAGRSEIYSNGALRMSWPVMAAIPTATLERRHDASRFLLQTSCASAPPTRCTRSSWSRRPTATCGTRAAPTPTTWI